MAARPALGQTDARSLELQGLPPGWQRHKYLSHLCQPSQEQSKELDQRLSNWDSAQYLRESGVLGQWLPLLCEYRAPLQDPLPHGTPLQHPVPHRAPLQDPLPHRVILQDPLSYKVFVLIPGPRYLAVAMAEWSFSLCSLRLST